MLIGWSDISLDHVIVKNKPVYLNVWWDEDIITEVLLLLSCTRLLNWAASQIEMTSLNWFKMLSRSKIMLSLHLRWPILVFIFPELFDSSKVSLSPLSILLMLIILQSTELGCFDASRCLSFFLFAWGLKWSLSSPIFPRSALSNSLSLSVFRSLLVTPAICPAVVFQVPLKPIKGARNKFAIWQNGTSVESVKRYDSESHWSVHARLLLAGGWRVAYAHSCPNGRSLTPACTNTDVNCKKWDDNIRPHDSRTL